MSDVIIRTKIPMYIVSIISVLIIIEYFVSLAPLSSFKGELMTWATIIYNFAAFVGAIQVFRFNTKRISQGKGLERYYGVTTIASFFLFLAVGWGIGLGSSTYTSLYIRTLVAISSTLWGLNLVYSAMGVYRAMRLTSLEALALFLCGLVYFLKEMPLMVAIFPPLSAIGEWIMKFPGGSSYRVGVLTAAMAALTIAIRTILQREASAIE